MSEQSGAFIAELIASRGNPERCRARLEAAQQSAQVCEPWLKAFV